MHPSSYIPFNSVSEMRQVSMVQKGSAVSVAKRPDQATVLVLLLGCLGQQESP